ncbi:hypothetical protein A0H81_08771 [Grifola frondosa]|uniref:Uncharacterized protein n=1 Tax=Grifola frondosa TaxID=5627 RepID=A0A1C7M3T3_GRIFR|nr:hypothetical protein A0H81_08771 [Grifola frondosa]
MADEDIKFKGDVSLEKQKTIARYTNKVLNKADFGASTGKRIVTKEIAIFKRPEDNKTQARAVCEIVVDKAERSWRSSTLPRRTVDVSFLLVPRYGCTAGTSRQRRDDYLQIWDATNKRLVASGVHNKMIPSQPKL